MTSDIATNKKALFNYEILESLEAGLVLSGDEVKALRDKSSNVGIIGSYARLLSNKQLDHPELFWVGGTISVAKGDKMRSRKLLVQRRELNKMIGKLQEKHLTLVPLRLYWARGRAKLQLGLARGKQLHDKRETLKRRDMDRQLDLAHKSR